MKKNACYSLIILTAFIWLSASSSGSLPGKEWNRTLGGTYGEGIWSAQETDDGGYILTGYTASRGEGSDLWLVRLDAEGESIWNRIFGGSGEDAGYSVQQTKDGGFVVAGSTASYGVGGERLWLLKTDSNGSKLWDKTFGGFVSSAGDGGWSVNETDDGGYIVTGYTKSSGAGEKDLWLIKTDSRGNRQWDKTFGGPKDDVGMSVIQMDDGGYAAVGRTASYGSGKDDIWLLKVDFEGKEQWNATFGGAEDDVAFQILKLSDGYALAGRTESRPDGKKAILIKTDFHGRKVWERVFGEGTSGISLQKTSDGGFIMAGSIDSPQTGKDAILIKTDSSGKEQWSRALGGQNDDIGSCAFETKDGDFILAGITSSFGAGAEDAWLVKLQPGADASVDEKTGERIAAGNTSIDAAINETTSESASTASTNSASAQPKPLNSQNIFKQKKQLFPDVFSNKDLGYKPLSQMSQARLLRQPGQSS